MLLYEADLVLDDTLALMVIAYGEWGNPNVAADYAYMGASERFEYLKQMGFERISGRVYKKYL